MSGPPSARSGESFPISLTVCNQGNLGGETEVSLYLSPDEVISNSADEGVDPRVGGTGSLFLDAGQCTTRQVPGWFGGSLGGSSLPSLYLGAIVNPSRSAPELLVGNNAWTGDRMSIRYSTGSGPLLSSAP